MIGLSSELITKVKYKLHHIKAQLLGVINLCNIIQSHTQA